MTSGYQVVTHVCWDVDRPGPKGDIHGSYTVIEMDPRHRTFTVVEQGRTGMEGMINGLTWCNKEDRPVHLTVDTDPNIFRFIAHRLSGLFTHISRAVPKRGEFPAIEALCAIKQQIGKTSDVQHDKVPRFFQASFPEPGADPEPHSRVTL